MQVHIHPPTHSPTHRLSHRVGETSSIHPPTHPPTPPMHRNSRSTTGRSSPTSLPTSRSNSSSTETPTETSRYVKPPTHPPTHPPIHPPIHPCIYYNSPFIFPYPIINHPPTHPPTHPQYRWPRLRRRSSSPAPLRKSSVSLPPTHPPTHPPKGRDKDSPTFQPQFHSFGSSTHPPTYLYYLQRRFAPMGSIKESSSLSSTPLGTKAVRVCLLNSTRIIAMLWA